MIAGPQDDARAAFFSKMPGRIARWHSSSGFRFPLSLLSLSSVAINVSGGEGRLRICG
jgi:hypothetical protein